MRQHPTARIFRCQLSWRRRGTASRFLIRPGPRRTSAGASFMAGARDPPGGPTAMARGGTGATLRHISRAVRDPYRTWRVRSSSRPSSAPSPGFATPNAPPWSWQTEPPRARRDDRGPERDLRASRQCHAARVLARSGGAAPSWPRCWHSLILRWHLASPPAGAWERLNAGERLPINTQPEGP